MTPPPPSHEVIRAEAERAARRFRLPFSRRAWKGVAGCWVGAATGNSIDFQDHRAYQWGDDPRAIHWAAYARTGQLSMKLYRAELSPVADIVVDVSASMLHDPARAASTEALLLFCVLSAARAGSQVRIRAVLGNRSFPIDRQEALSGRWRERFRELPGDDTPPRPTFGGQGALRLFISDLLYPGEPSALLDPMASRDGLSVILCPTLREEAAISETGNMRLIDCESGRARHQQITESIARRYARAYASHFDQWGEACRRRRILFSRVPCHLPLAEALAVEACLLGVVEAV